MVRCRQKRTGSVTRAIARLHRTKPPRGEANMQSTENEFYTTIKRVSVTAIAAVTMLAAGAANAQLPMPVSTQFDITGFIQEATLDPACAAAQNCGGTITVQGHKIVIPKETIVLYPANASTWQEM